jgi:hypothetical protein
VQSEHVSCLNHQTHRLVFLRDSAEKEGDPELLEQSYRVFGNLKDAFVLIERLTLTLYDSQGDRHQQLQLFAVVLTLYTM